MTFCYMTSYDMSEHISVVPNKHIGLLHIYIFSKQSHWSEHGYVTTKGTNYSHPTPNK